MFSFLKNSILGVIAVVSRMGISFFLNKMVALFFGPVGIVQLAHFQYLITLFTIIPNDGISRGLIKFLAGNPKDSPLFQVYFKTGFYLSLIVFFVTAALLVVVRPFVYLNFPPHFTSVSLFLLGTFLLVAQSFFNAVLLVRNKNSLLVLGNIITALGIVGYVGLVQNHWPISYFLLGYLLVLSSFGLIMVPLGLKGLAQVQLFRPGFSAPSWRQLSKFIVMAASVLLFSKGLEYYIRVYLMQHYTVEQTGLWQGMIRISDSYTALYSAILAYAFYPKVATLLSKESELKLFVRSSMLLLVPVVISGLLFVYFARLYVITFLLSSRFVVAQEFLPYQLVGDFFKLISWLLANMLVAQAKFKIILLFEAFSAFAYLGFFYFFTGRYGLSGTPMAHCAHYMVFFGLNLFYYRKLFTS